jgi:hypothetical protein
MAAEPIDPVQLRRVLAGHFDEGELRTLCFDLGLEYDAIPGRDTAEKARELVAAMRRRNRLAELVDAVRRERAGLPWEEWLAAARAHPAGWPAEEPGQQAPPAGEEAARAGRDYAHGHSESGPVTIVMGGSRVDQSRNVHLDRGAGRPPLARIVAGVLVAALLGLLSNLLAGYLAETYGWLDRPAGLVVALIVFALALAAEMALLFRRG